MSVRKTVIKLTVLSPGDMPCPTDGMSLEQIAREADQGEFVLGMVTLEDTILPDERVTAELEAVGSDASFFDAYREG